MLELSGKTIHYAMNERMVPYSVAFELTSACNLDCIHCYHLTSKQKELSLSEVIAVLDELAGLGSMDITFTGGEILTRPDFPEILHHAVKNTRFSVKLFSNLTLLNGKLADLVAGMPANRVETTLLGPDADIHDRLAGFPGAFDSTIMGIRMLKERQVRVTAKTVVMKPNQSHVKEMYALAEKIGIEFRHDDGMFVESQWGRKPLSLQIDEAGLKRKNKNRGKTALVNGGCNAGKSVMRISPDGYVYPCGPFQIPAGNVRETKLENIWHDSVLMKRVRELEKADYECCRDCVYLLRCSGCIAMGIGLARGRIVPCRVAKRKLRGLSE